MITRRRTYAWGISAVVGAALILSSCGGNGDANEPDNGGGKDDKAEQTPLEPYLGPGGSGLGMTGGRMFSVASAGGDEASQEEERAKQRRVEEAVVDCMKEAGFDYVVYVPDDKGGKKFEEAYSLPPLEFAKKYGYGVTTLDQLMPAEDDNPNQEIRDKLTAQAKKAYDKALYGAGAVQMEGGGGAVVKAEKPGSGNSTPNPDEIGCYGKASEEVFGKRKGEEMDFTKFDSLFKDLEALRKRMEGDQRVKDAQQAWSDCMADKGHPGFKKPEDAQKKVWDEFSEASQAANPDQGNDKAAPKPMPMNLPADKRKEIRDLELKLAPADVECQQKEYEAKVREVQIEVEQEFLDQHKAELEEYRTAMAEAGIDLKRGVG